MKLIESSVQIIEEKDPYKMIELAGRICYKSENNITADSAKEFVDRMIKLGHGAMLEHGTVYLRIREEVNGNMPPAMLYWRHLANRTYSRINYKIEADRPYKGNYGVLYITTNMRVLVENERLDDLQYQCEPTEYHDKRITAKFICDRGVSHEFVRHRVFSFAQESTRYCNYSKDKFGNELTFIKPAWFEREDLNDNINADFEDQLIDTEERYFSMMGLGLKPQEVRAILPNALKTELVMTGFESDWEHFFELRCSKAAHPDAQKLANELKELLTNVKNN